MKDIINGIFSLVEKTGVFATLSLCLVGIIFYMIYYFNKQSRLQKNYENFEKKISDKSNDIVRAIRTFVDQNGITNKTIFNKIDRLEKEFDKIQTQLSNLDRGLISSLSDQKIIVSNIDRIINKVLDIAADLRGLVFSVKNNDKRS